MSYDFDASLGRTPEGAEFWRGQQPLDSSAQKLADMITAAASQGEQIDSNTIMKQSRAFVEGFVVSLAGALRDQADVFSRAADRDSSERFGGLEFDEAINRATALGDISTALENLLSQETIEEMRED